MTTLSETSNLNAYHIELTYTVRQPAAFTLVGKDEEAVQDLARKMLSGAEEIEFVKIVNYKDIPELVLLKEAQDKARNEQMASTPVEEAEVIENKTIN